MRQISFDEAGAVSGADCGDLTMSIGLTGVSVSGSLSDWGSCVYSGYTFMTDMYNSWSSHYSTGIPYGYAHVA